MATGPGFVLIAGPTASGKSALAAELAQREDAVIVNADSMQIYEGLPILTAQPTRRERSATPHRLYGEIGPQQPCSVADWAQMARRIAEQAQAAGQKVIFCGGTGLYFRALEEGISQIPPIDPQIRVRWREFATHSPESLHGELLARDAQGASRLNPGDTQRLVRALEVVESTGKPIAHWQGRGKKPLIGEGVRVERHLIMPERATLHERIDRRFDQMLYAGAVEEARAFLDRGLDGSLPAMKAIGLRELGASLAGAISLDEARERAKAATRQYAKRQVTWFRHQTGANWTQTGS